MEREGREVRASQRVGGEGLRHSGCNLSRAWFSTPPLLLTPSSPFTPLSHPSFLSTRKKHRENNSPNVNDCLAVTSVYTVHWYCVGYTNSKHTWWRLLGPYSIHRFSLNVTCRWPWKTAVGQWDNRADSHDFPLLPLEKLLSTFMPLRNELSWLAYIWEPWLLRLGPIAAKQFEFAAMWFVLDSLSVERSEETNVNKFLTFTFFFIT